MAGLAALVWSLAPGLTPDQVQGILQDSAVDLGPAGWDPDYRLGAHRCAGGLAGDAATARARCWRR